MLKISEEINKFTKTGSVKLRFGDANSNRIDTFQCLLSSNNFARESNLLSVNFPTAFDPLYEQPITESGSEINATILNAVLFALLEDNGGDRIKIGYVEGDCVGGPSRNMTISESKKFRDNLIGQADGRKVLENLKNTGADTVPMHR